MDEWEQPSRAELERDLYENWLADTYEERYQAFCWEQGLDPEDMASVHAYENAWKEWTEEH